MNNITMIAAVGKNLELGRKNDLIWRFKEDMTFFREQTMGKPMVMGYNTFKSLPKVLPGRKHIVLCFEKVDLGEDVDVVTSMDELLDKINEYPEVMIIGGASIYQQMIDYSNKLILTEVDAEAAQTPISDDIYYIVPGKCTECKGFHEEPQCAAVCPVDCCVPDEDHVESDEVLLERQAFLHNE